jgi:putative glycosyltransferase
MKLSIVTTLYYSSKYIDDFYKRVSKEAQKITNDYEIIFVDDGSPDDSLEKAIALYKQDSRVKVIELSRNFGHHKAIMTGLSHAKGEYIFLIDSDLEEEPELLSRFWQELQSSENIDVVYGVQESRKGGWFERWSGEIFYKIYNFLNSINIPNNMITARLMTKKYVEQLIRHKEIEVCFGCILMNTGFKQKEIIVKKHNFSPTTYTFRRKVALMMTSVISFSSKPLVLVFNLGLLITILSIFYILKLLFDKLVNNIMIEGWTSVMVSVWFFGGLIMLSIGIVGIYLSKIFIETKNRPYTVIRNIFNHEVKNE